METLADVVGVDMVKKTNLEVGWHAFFVDQPAGLGTEEPL